MNLAASGACRYSSPRSIAPATRHTTTSGAGEVVWRMWGAGTPLVLLHGGTGSWMHWVRNVEDAVASTSC